MSDPSPPPITQLQIPEETAKKFHDLIELIKGSESMNTDERQYWINILPIMTPEQLKNLTDILTNEKEQLAAIDARYESGVPTTSVEEIETKMKQRKAVRTKAEIEADKHERAKEDDILSQIQSI